MVNKCCLLFGRIVRLDSFRDDGTGSVTFLVVLTLGGDRTGDVTTRHHYTSHNDCHDQKLFHIV